MGGSRKSQPAREKTTTTQPTETRPAVTCSGLLSWDEIIRHGLILNPDDEPIFDKDPKKAPKVGQNPSGSYDLSVGDRHFLFQPNGEWKLVFLGGLDALEKENEGVADSSFRLQSSENGSEVLIIPPFCSAIIQLDETVDLYSVAKSEHIMIAGRFDLKLSAIYKGLISQQATQVEPCYRGKLYCFVHNLGKKPIELEKGMKVATIEFSYVGQSSDSEERDNRISDTISYNSREKYGKKHFSYSVHEGDDIKYTGIGDIRWLKEVKRLPDECGIAPIYSLVTGEINDYVDTHLEKSSTVEMISDRVSNRIKEKENLLRIMLALALAVITLFATNLVTEVRAELRYFSEELTVFSEKYASFIATDESKGTFSKSNEPEKHDYNDHSNPDIPGFTTTPVVDNAPKSTIAPDNNDTSQSAYVSTHVDDSDGTDALNSLEAIKEHTQELSRVRTTFLVTSIVALVVMVIAALFTIHFWSTSGEQKWIRKKRELEAKQEYLRTAKRISEQTEKKVKRKRDCLLGRLFRKNKEKN